jgi:hypothetical protein
MSSRKRARDADAAPPAKRRGPSAEVAAMLARLFPDATAVATTTATRAQDIRGVNRAEAAAFPPERLAGGFDELLAARDSDSHGRPETRDRAARHVRAVHERLVADGFASAPDMDRPHGLAGPAPSAADLQRRARADRVLSEDIARAYAAAAVVDHAAGAAPALPDPELALRADDDRWFRPPRTLPARTVNGVKLPRVVEPHCPLGGECAAQNHPDAVARGLNFVAVAYRTPSQDAAFEATGALPAQPLCCLMDLRRVEAARLREPEGVAARGHAVMMPSPVRNDFDGADEYDPRAMAIHTRDDGRVVFGLLVEYRPSDYVFERDADGAPRARQIVARPDPPERSASSASFRAAAGGQRAPRPRPSHRVAA